MDESARIHQILDFGSKEDKIIVLESLSQSGDQETVNKIISKLDDSEIEVRGEAFSSLFLNKNDISEFLIDALSSESKNVKGFLAFVLVNRGDSNAIYTIENNLLTITPMENWYGTINAIVTASDEELSDSDDFTLTVESVNDAPEVINEISNLVVDEDSDPYQIDISEVFSDVENGSNLSLFVAVLGKTNVGVKVLASSKDRIP